MALMILLGIAILDFFLYANALECPKNVPIEIDGNCYRLQTDPARFSDALENCPKFNEKAWLTSIKSEKVLKKIEKLVYDFIVSKMEKALFWIGFYMDDRSLSTPVKDRKWKWNYDDEIMIQKDYSLWEEQGGPSDKGLTCATINASNEFLAKPVDCGGPRLPVICMMEEGKECKHDVAPYLKYGDYCLAGLNGALEYNKILGACSPSAPTKYVDIGNMKKSVILCAKNSFLGGGIYMNMRRVEGKFVDLSDGSEPDKDMWEEGEPRPNYDCVGLALQQDNTLKYRTISCEFLAASLCALKD